jgi:integrase/recombinase XerD
MLELSPTVAADVIEVISTPPPSLAEQVRVAFLRSYRAGKTLSAYTRDLDGYFHWCDQHDLDPLHVRRQHVEAWVRQLERTIAHGRPLAPATVHRAVAVVRSFYSYAVACEVITRSPVPARSRELHLARVPTASQTLGLDRSEATTLLAAARSRAAQDGAIVSLMLHQGLRTAEVCSLDTEGLGACRSHRTVTVHRKGGQAQTVALAPVAAADLDRWLAERAAPTAALVCPGQAPGCTPLFLATRGAHAGQRIRSWHIEHIITINAKRAGLSGRISPHSLRHTCITQALDEGVPVRDIQRFAGHLDPKTTLRYDRSRDDLDRSPAYKLSGIFG